MRPTKTSTKCKMCGKRYKLTGWDYTLEELETCFTCLNITRFVKNFEDTLNYQLKYGINPTKAEVKITFKVKYSGTQK